MKCQFCENEITVKQIVNKDGSMTGACCKNILVLFLNKKLNLDIADVTLTIDGETKVYPAVL
jgi:hypothetical protein